MTSTWIGSPKKLRFSVWPFGLPKKGSPFRETLLYFQRPMKHGCCAVGKGMEGPARLCPCPCLWLCPCPCPSDSCPRSQGSCLATTARSAGLHCVALARPSTRMAKRDSHFKPWEFQPEIGAPSAPLPHPPAMRGRFVLQPMASPMTTNDEPAQTVQTVQPSRGLTPYSLLQTYWPNTEFNLMTDQVLVLLLRDRLRSEAVPMRQPCGGLVPCSEVRGLLQRRSVEAPAASWVFAGWQSLPTPKK